MLNYLNTMIFARSSRSSGSSSSSSSRSGGFFSKPAPTKPASTSSSSSSSSSTPSRSMSTAAAPAPAVAHAPASTASHSSFGPRPTPAAAPHAPAPAAPAAAPPAVAPIAQAPAQSGGMLSGLGSTIMQGMAFGAGSAVAHKAVDAVLGGKTVEHVHKNEDGTPYQAAAAAAPASAATGSTFQATKGECGQQIDSFQQCMKANDNNISACQYFFDTLNQCQTDAKERL